MQHDSQSYKVYLAARDLSELALRIYTLKSAQVDCQYDKERFHRAIGNLLAETLNKES